MRALGEVFFFSAPEGTWFLCLHCAVSHSTVPPLSLFFSPRPNHTSCCRKTIDVLLKHKAVVAPNTGNALLQLALGRHYYETVPSCSLSLTNSPKNTWILLWSCASRLLPSRLLCFLLLVLIPACVCSGWSAYFC